MLFIHLRMVSLRPLYIGAGIGLGLSALLFLTVPVYHDFLVWSWTTPWMFSLGVLSAVVYYLFDD